MKLSMLILLVLSSSCQSRTIDETLTEAREDTDDVIGTSDVTGDSASLHDLDMMLTEEQMRSMFSSEEADDLSPPEHDLNSLEHQGEDLNPEPIDFEIFDHPHEDLSPLSANTVDQPPHTLSPESAEHVIASDVDVLEGGLDTAHDSDVRLTDEQRQLLFGYLDQEKAKEPRVTEPPTTTTTTTTTTPMTTSRAHPDTAPCEDANQHCFFARKNRAYCDSNIYVKMYCRKSCGICDMEVTTECADVIDVCAHLRGLGYCEGIFREFMGTVCKQTCQLC